MKSAKLTKETLSTHFHYGRFIYIVLGLLAFGLSDLIFTTTAYQTPGWRLVDIQLVGPYANVDVLNDVAARALKDGQAYETAQAVAAGTALPDQPYEAPLQEVRFTFLSFSADDYVGLDKLTAQLAAWEGDIYIVSKDQLQFLLDNQCAEPLDDYIARGILKPGDRDLSQVTFPAYADSGEPAGTTHVYALQADELNGLIGDGNTTFAFDVRGTYMVLTSFSENKDTSAVVMQSLIDQLTAPLPAWLSTPRPTS